MLPACAGKSCDDGAAAGIEVFLVDEATGQGVCSATVTIADHSYVEALQVRPNDGGGHTCVYIGAWERPGTYRVSVTAAGYRPVQQDNVVAEPGTCHVQVATVTITLAH